jgi:TP901 family phage tail tape measure protein
MPIVDELIAILGYKIEGKGKLNEFTRGLDGVENKARRTSTAMAGFGRTLVGAFAGTAVVGAVKSAVTNFADFERQMTRIGVTAGASVEATSKASSEVQKLAQDFALPIDQAVRGLDTLVASGQSLEQAMDFLPSVLKAAQASGAATEDIANTALKAASALEIQSDKLDRAFDIMIKGGKEGQFELRGMAQFIPELVNSFASLGYKGEPGLQKLIALLQTVREDTGSASGAATQLQNVFGKIYSDETARNFKDFGIDLEAQLKKAKAAGEDTISAFVRLSNEAIKGDLSKLPKLFSDQEFRLGMQSLMTSADSFQKFLAALSSADVDGTVLRDLGVVLSDTQSKIDQLGISWDRFMKALGGTVAGPLSSGMDLAFNTLNFDAALRKGAAASGMSIGELFMKQPFMNRDELDDLARKGGFVPLKGGAGERLYSGADSRKAPRQLAREKLEAERDALQAEIKALEDTPHPAWRVWCPGAPRRASGGTSARHGPHQLRDQRHIPG